MQTTLGQRIRDAMRAIGIHDAELARRAKTTTATIANWTNDHVEPGHVKAQMLFQIADALGADPRQLLTGETIKGTLREAIADYQSQEMQLPRWKLAFQLVAEALDEQGLQLPAGKRAEVTLLAYDLLQEGVQDAKVMRFVRASAA